MCLFDCNKFCNNAGEVFSEITKGDYEGLIKNLACFKVK